MKLFKEYARRFSIETFGLFIYAFGSLLGVKAGMVGTNAWNTLSLGMSDVMGISFGMANFIVSLIIIIIAILGKGDLGFGSIINIVLYPIFADWLLAIFSFVPVAENMAFGLFLTLLCQVIISFATIIYMSPALGCGPRDTLMIILGRKVPKVPIGAVRFCVEAAAMAVGVLLGAPFGIGTVLVMVLQASIFQLACRICRYEPRDVKHENFALTIKRVRDAVHAN